MRYWRIVSDATVRLDEAPENVEFIHTPPELDGTLDRIRSDIVMAIIYDMCRVNFGNGFSARRVAFRHPAPADASPYEALFGCPVSFGTDANRVSARTIRFGSVTLLDGNGHVRWRARAVMELLGCCKDGY